mgnify:CR=1 FL=1
MSDKKIPLLVVCGPTASGKTAAGAALAKEYGGEVVSADSMQIYKGLDIATAKPTEEETDGIPHHLISTILHLLSGKYRKLPKEESFRF